MPAYPHGTPSWAELNVADPEAAVAFYTGLFGWRAGERSAEGGGYRMFLQDDVPVAGLIELQQPEQPVSWVTYISVDDADETELAVVANGGRTLVPPMAVLDLGRLAFFADSAEAVFGIWEPGSFAGAGLTNVPVSMCWNEVLTRDRDAVLAFYPAVFGWRAVAPNFEPNGGYMVWRRPDGQMVGGALAMDEQWFPAELSAHWAVSFAVADTDAIVARAENLGATVTMPAMDCPIGRFASFRDPQGATFGVMAFAD